MPVRQQVRFRGDYRVFIVVGSAVIIALILGAAGQAILQENEVIAEPQIISDPPAASTAEERADRAASALGAVRIDASETVNDAIQVVTIGSATAITGWDREAASAAEDTGLPGIVAPDGSQFFLPSTTITPGARFGWRLRVENNGSIKQITALTVTGLPDGTAITAVSLSPSSTVVIPRGGGTFMIQLEPGESEGPNMELRLTAPLKLVKGGHDVQIVLNPMEF